MTKGWTDFHIHAPDEATALQAAVEALPHGFEIVREDEETGEYVWRTSSHNHAIAIRGTRYHDDAEYDEEGEQTKAPTPMDGWWAVLRVREPMTSEVQSVLQLVAEPLGVEVVEDAGVRFAE